MSLPNPPPTTSSASRSLQRCRPLTPPSHCPSSPPPPHTHTSLSLTHTPLSQRQFLAEWGDRSQIATIALAAKNEPFGTTIGGIIGHALCTGAAVLGGKVLSEKISKKAVLFIGASEGAPFV
jgi:putative Ca2+/H+ antiporter (TMEM165/GDT1 family)